jgi:hypothetical protein
MSSSIIVGVTQLTSLCLITANHEMMAGVVPALEGMSHLQELAVTTDPHSPALVQQMPFIISTSQFQPMLSINTLLTSLTLGIVVDQEGFDILLAHAPQLASLTCRQLRLDVDRSSAPCRWQKLEVYGQQSDMRCVAYLPLGSLQQLGFAEHRCVGKWELPSTSPYLVCSNAFSAAEPLIVQQALINISKCPAWKSSGPVVSVYILAGRPERISETLSVLSYMDSKQVQLIVDAVRAEMGAPQVQLLHQALGSRLTHLTLKRCSSLAADLWSALWCNLPALCVFTLGDHLPQDITAQQLTSFCTSATRPLQLIIGEGLLSKLSVSKEWLEQQCTDSEFLELVITASQPPRLYRVGPGGQLLS